jgi:hypothetical protein
MARDITMVLAAVVVAILVLFTIQDWNIRQEVSESKVLEASGSAKMKTSLFAATPQVCVFQ